MMIALYGGSWLNVTVDQTVWWSLLLPTLRVAQSFQDNLGGSVQDAWDTFIQSGQVWALMIGFILGYLFRTMTSY